MAAKPKATAEASPLVARMELDLDGFIDPATAAKLCNCTARWLNMLAADGYIDRPGRQGYRLANLVHGVIQQAKDGRKESTKAASASRAQDARADEIKVRTDERTGRLLREAQTEAIDILSEYAGGLRADLQAIPARFTMDLKERARLAKDIDRAFDDASKQAAASANLVEGARRRLETTGRHRPKAVGRGKPKVSGKHRAPGAAKS